jgi:pyruvate dehydrogenase E2 component (dihydrolipoamide acetyltransferase)
MALKEFRLPDIGEGIAEGEIVSWKVKPGQQVKEEDEFVEVMTDKATVMITSPFTGVVKELKYKEGDVVPVESVIAVFEVSGAAGADAKPAGKASAPEAKAPPAPAKTAAPGIEPRTPAPPESGEGAGDDGAGAMPEREPSRGNAAPPARRPVEVPRPAPAPVAAAAPAFERAEAGKVLAAPATRRRAREMGIDLHSVEGTGPRGRVTNEDLERAPAAVAHAPAAQAPATPPAPPSTKPTAPAAPKVPAFTPIAVPAGTREERRPFRGLRRKIAEAMTRSKHTAAHFTYVDDIDVTELVKLRKEAKALYAEAGVNITYLPFIMKAVVAAMRQYPEMNSALDETTNEWVIKHYYNFGIATDTDNGLVVPVVKNVDTKSIVQLAKDIQDLAEATRAGKISVEHLQGGTFSITNAGNIGGLFATPIINFPEVAIMGVHKIKPTPVVRDGQVVVGDVMYLSISIDHRLVDGATGARWMNVVKDCLENPKKLLLGSL